MSMNIVIAIMAAVPGPESIYFNTPPIVAGSSLPYLTYIIDDAGQTPGWADHWYVANFRIICTGDFNLGSIPVLTKLQAVYDVLHKREMNVAASGGAPAFRGMLQMVQGPRMYPLQSNLLCRGWIEGMATGSLI